MPKKTPSSAPPPASSARKTPSTGSKAAPPNQKKGLTYEDRLTIIKRRENRETMVAIAADYGVSRQNIAQIIELYRQHGLEGLKSRPTGRKRMARLTPAQIEHLREVIAEHPTPANRGVAMSRLKNVWYAESLRKLIYREFRLRIPQLHCRELCRALKIPQSINMGLLNPVRIAEGREKNPGYIKNLGKGTLAEDVPETDDEEEEICGDIDAIRRKLSEHQLKSAAKEVSAKRASAAAKKGFRTPPKNQATKARHARKKKRK